ncbi:MAG: ABC transporter permease [Caldilineales bacterium]|nr:ABC transporter permease [Caldilineales bacterium]
MTTSETTIQASTRPSFGRRLVEQREISIFLVVLFGAILLSLLSKNFLNPANLRALVLGLSFDAIVAVGMTVLMVSGGFDLSVGSVLALAGAVAGYGIVLLKLPVPVGIAAGLLTGVLVGLINGLLVSKVRVNPLIATLGMMQIARGAVFLLTAGLGIPNLPDSFNKMAQGKALGFQYPVYIMLVIVIVGDLLLRRSRFFRQSYFVGGNERSARLSGIRVGQVQITNYIITGLMAAVAGLLLTARMGTASVSAGLGVELRVVSAVVIGGASLAGGEGTVIGSIFGVALMALINNGLNLLGVNPYWQNIVIGAVLVIAVAADALSRRNRA